jgi:hypothetical protein
MLALCWPISVAIAPSAPGSFFRVIVDPRGAALGLVAPGEIDPVLLVGIGQADAVDAVDLDRLAGAAHADDAVAGHRAAILGEMEGDAGGEALDVDRVRSASASCSSSPSVEPGITASITCASVNLRRAIASISAVVLELEALERVAQRFARRGWAGGARSRHRACGRA